LIQKDRSYLEFIEFLVAFIDELNDLAVEGAAVLVEGQRDSSALVDLGYGGKILTRISLSSTRVDDSLKGVKSIVILTDMDKEGRKLAARYMGFFLPRGVKTSMSQRRRLKRASHGVFLHIENLSRFAPEVPEIRGLTEKMRL
jgi:5S rRNA maturation endonuclease (ribonuclease M5)